jgi:hypothetical protein
MQLLKPRTGPTQNKCPHDKEYKTHPKETKKLNLDIIFKKRRRNICKNLRCNNNIACEYYQKHIKT